VSHTLGAKPYYERKNMVDIEIIFIIDIYLVCITTDTCDASDLEVKRCQHIFASFSMSQSSLLEIRQDEAAEAAVDVKANAMRGSQGTESNYVILVAIWEVYG
jgi:hypothetical protein